MFRMALVIVVLIAFGACGQSAADNSDFSSLNTDAERAYRNGNYEESIRISSAALQIAQSSFGENSEQAFEQYARRGASFEMLGKYPEAVSDYRRLLAIFGALYGSKSVNATFAMEMLGRVLCKVKNFDEAEELFKSVVEIRKLMVFNGEDAFKSVNVLNFATLNLERGQWREALASYRQVIAMIKQQSISTSDSSIINTDPTNSATFVGISTAAWEIAKSNPGEAAAAMNEAFIDAQLKWQTSAARALAEAASRGTGARAKQVRKVQDLASQVAAFDTDLEKLQEDWLKKIQEDPTYSTLKEANRQSLPSSDDVAREMQQKLANDEKALKLSQEYGAHLEQCGYTEACVAKYKGLQDQIQALTAPSNPALLQAGQKLSECTQAGRSDCKAETDAYNLIAEGRSEFAMRAREKEIEGHDAFEKRKVDLYEAKGRVQAKLSSEQAVLAAMKDDASAPRDAPKPITLAEAQGALADNEALIFFLIGQEKSFVWAVTKTDSRWAPIELGARSLQSEVAALRCGLDYEPRCAGASKLEGDAADQDPPEPLPFDRDRAFRLYTMLFGDVESMIGGKSLLIVPTGALSQLPPQVLVTQKPEPEASISTSFSRTRWLIREHALTVLPSVSSLRALRRISADSRAHRPMVGFGNPLLAGSDADGAKRAAVAKAMSTCRDATSHDGMAAAERAVVSAFQLNKDGLADTATIMIQDPLPETAEELCDIARALGAAPDDIHLASHATESEIKTLSEAGTLSNYRIVHFATHGALAGEIPGLAEPGLLLTPPAKATRLDDGYLSETEIAGLKLDADWVILSACNTAASGVNGGEELSGMAQAFFYAGARALLVSHWSVDSEATRSLLTGALGRATDKKIGRAEAIRESMLAMIDESRPDNHPEWIYPEYWAPFVVVGEGASALHE